MTPDDRKALRDEEFRVIHGQMEARGFASWAQTLRHFKDGLDVAEQRAEANFRMYEVACEDRAVRVNELKQRAERAEAAADLAMRLVADYKEALENTQRGVPTTIVDEIGRHNQILSILRSDPQSRLAEAEFQLRICRKNGEQLAILADRTNDELRAHLAGAMRLLERWQVKFKGTTEELAAIMVDTNKFLSSTPADSLARVRAMGRVWQVIQQIDELSSGQLYNALKHAMEDRDATDKGT